MDGSTGEVAERKDAPAETAARADAGAGRVIVNPISGERIIIRQSGAQTDGRLLAFDLFLPPGGHVPAGHTHPTQEERFTVVAGAMRFKLRGKTILARPGDTVVVPQGTPHWFGAAGRAAAQARVEVRPALRMEEVFVSSAAMGQTHQLFGVRLPRLTDLARFLLEFRREVTPPHIPPMALNALQALLTRFAWLSWPPRRNAHQAASQRALPSTPAPERGPRSGGL